MAVDMQWLRGSFSTHFLPPPSCPSASLCPCLPFLFPTPYLPFMPGRDVRSVVSFPPLAADPAGWQVKVLLGSGAAKAHISANYAEKVSFILQSLKQSVRYCTNIMITC